MGIVVGPYLLPLRLPAQWHRHFMETGPWRYAWSHEAEIVVPVRWSSSAVWGKYPALIERYISRKVDWVSSSDYIGSSVAGGDARWYFPYGDIWRNMFMLTHLGLYNTSLQDLTSCDNLRCQHVKACHAEQYRLPWNGWRPVRKPIATIRRPWFDILRLAPFAGDICIEIWTSHNSYFTTF
jgi:hypothetical protein